MVQLYAALFQIPGMDAPTLTWQEQVAVNWEGMGFMRWPLAVCLGLGIIVIIIKFVTLTAKASTTKRILKDVDELLVRAHLHQSFQPFNPNALTTFFASS